MPVVVAHGRNAATCHLPPDPAQGTEPPTTPAPALDLPGIGGGGPTPDLSGIGGPTPPPPPICRGSGIQLSTIEHAKG
jgi:hypothetical protein